jgi:Tfp pilus assembly protein PilF
MEAPWIVEANGKKFGPFTTDQLMGFAKSGKIQPNFLVRKNGGPAVACAALKWLFGQGAPPRSDAERRPSTEPRPAGGASSSPVQPTSLAADYLVEAAAAATHAPPLQPAAPPAPVVATSASARPPGFSSFATTGAAILVGAAAAVLIYINLRSVVQPYGGSNDAEQGAVAAGPGARPLAAAAPQIVVAPAPAPAPTSRAMSENGAAPIAPPPAAEAPQVAANAGQPGPPPAAGRTSIAEARRSLVQLRLPMNAGRTVIGSGFVVDGFGTIATTLSACRQGSSLQAVFHDGSVADVLGFLAAATGRDLVLLKTAKGDTAPLAAGTSATAGTSVFVAGANATGGVALTPTTVDRAEQLATPIQGANGAIHLDAGLHAAILHDRVPPTSRGGAVLSEQGELLGLLSVATNGEQFVIDHRHLTELMQSSDGIVRPVAELLPAEGAVAGIPAGAGRPPMGMPGFAGPGFAGPAGAAPGFGAPGFGAPGFGVPAAGGPGRVRVFVNGVPVQPAVPQQPALIGTSGSWINLLDSIYQRRAALISTRNKIQSVLRPLLAEANRLDREYRSLDQQARGVRARYAAVEDQIATLQRRRLIETDTYSIDDALDNARRELSRLQFTFQDLESDAGDLRNQFNAMKPQIDAQNDRMATMVKDANLLRTEFLKHLDPFGAPSKERGEEGVGYFSDKIKSEGDPSFALFGRGCAYLSRADNNLALADFDAAVKGAPQEAIFLTVRGVALSRLGDAAKARKDLADAIRFEDKNYWCRFQYALVLCRTEGFAIIEQQLKECMKLDPQATDAFTMMAMIKATGDDKIRHADYALRMAQTAYDLSPTKSWDVTMAMAAAHAEKGDFESAIKYAEESVNAAGERQAEWCRGHLQTVQAKKPLRIDWKTFDFWALL